MSPTPLVSLTKHQPYPPPPSHPNPELPTKQPLISNPALQHNRTYTLTPSGPCHRTQVALRTQTLPSFFAWKKWVECQSEEEDGEEQEKLAGEYLARKILDVGLEVTNRALGGLREEGREDREEKMMPEDIRRVLVKRWGQIRDMILGSYECTGCAPPGGVLSHPHKEWERGAVQ